VILSFIQTGKRLVFFLRTPEKKALMFHKEKSGTSLRRNVEQSTPDRRFENSLNHDIGEVEREQGMNDPKVT
jgi:hypothetical protein